MFLTFNEYYYNNPNEYFHLSSQWEEYRKTSEGWYIMVNDVEIGPIPLDKCFEMDKQIEKHTNVSHTEFFYEKHKDKTTDYNKVMKERYGIDLQARPEHNGDDIAEELRAKKESLMQKVPSNDNEAS